MRVYIDLVLLINFIFDFIVLLGTSIILKRRVKLYKIIIGCLVGTLSMLVLFIRFNTFSLFLFKIIISSLMLITTFNYRDIRFFLKNTYYFYMISIILGGLIYFFNNQFMVASNMMFTSCYRYNIYFGIVISVIGIIIYLRNIKDLKLNYNKYLKAIIYFKNYEIEVNAFMDTGNKLKDPYLFRPIILVKEDIIRDKSGVLFVPYNTCSSSGILECIRAEKIYIDGYGYKKNFLVGLSNNINLDGINCILNERLLEG